MTKVKVRPLRDLVRLRVLRKAELVLVLLVGTGQRGGGRLTGGRQQTQGHINNFTLEDALCFLVLWC